MVIWLFSLIGITILDSPLFLNNKNPNIPSPISHIIIKKAKIIVVTQLSYKYLLLIENGLKLG